MGYMTVVSILNDGWHTIEHHLDEFSKNIFDGMTGCNHGVGPQKMVNSYPVGNHCNPMQVAKSFHADCPQVFYVGQNCMTMLTDWTSKNKSDIEFQLERIKAAKSMLNYQEKELKKKLKEFERFHVGNELLCKKDYTEIVGQDKWYLLKTGTFYKIIDINNVHAVFRVDDDKIVGVPVLEIAYYFDVKE